MQSGEILFVIKLHVLRIPKFIKSSFKAINCISCHYRQTIPYINNPNINYYSSWPTQTCAGRDVIGWYANLRLETRPPRT